ncbi:hypothetical protein HU200_049561 [Digitaria exilis]|uniref:Uncharacterized protein n=1 Tax=Digitaria exilis TaxID=1010633 RepID=A0A835ATH4_9POAL|nr:hypothetical protein HU200_049561 [Digitaria exilis]
MAVLEESCSGAAVLGDDGSDRQKCSCLPFCFWGGDSSAGWANDESTGAAARRRRWRRRRRLRLTWLAWPWSFFRKGGENKGASGGGDGRDKGRKKKKWRGRRLLLLLTASLQPKKALESVVSGDGALLPAKVRFKFKPGGRSTYRSPWVSSFGDAKKKSNPQASTTTAATASTRWTSTAHARSQPETTIQPSPGGGPTGGGPAVAAGRMWRTPSRRHTFHDLDGADRPGGGLWTAATTLGVIVLFGRVTAVVFLCSCLYGARFVRVRLGGRAKAKAKSSGGAAGRSSGRWSGDPAGVVAAEKKVVVAEHKCEKKVVVAEHKCEKKVGLIDRAGKTPSSRFGR